MSKRTKNIGRTIQVEVDSPLIIIRSSNVGLDLSVETNEIIMTDYEFSDIISFAKDNGFKVRKTVFYSSISIEISW